MKIGFIGAGKVGKALGLYFVNHGIEVTGYFSRTAQSARDAAARTSSAEFASIEAVAATSDVVFLTVPDHALQKIDRKAVSLIGDGDIGAEKVWVHTSGAHPSDILAGIKASGGAVASLHPLQSFGAPEADAARLNSVWFTLEGTEKAVDAVRSIMTQTGGRYSMIEAGSKALYHAGACVISNFLVTLLESGTRLFEAAGMDRRDVFRAVEPLLDSTLNNVREKGTIDALTGPIVRGDYNTVDTHLRAMERLLPSELALYRALALKTAKMLEGNRLVGEQAERFRHILEEKIHV